MLTSRSQVTSAPPVTVMGLSLSEQERGFEGNYSSHILERVFLPESSTTASPPILFVSCLLDCQAANTKLLRIQDKSWPVHVPGIGCFLGSSMERTSGGFAAQQILKLVCKAGPWLGIVYSTSPLNCWFAACHELQVCNIGHQMIRCTAHWSRHTGQIYVNNIVDQQLLISKNDISSGWMDGWVVLWLHIRIWQSFKKWCSVV